MKSLIIGRGEIGKAVSQVIGRKDTVISYDVYDGPPRYIKDVDILHICFPFVDGVDFVSQVKEYIAQFKPMHVIIWSTLPIGTTKLVIGAVHSPVEGVHPNLVESIKKMTRWIGANNPGEGEFFANYFRDLQMAAKVVDSSDYTEFVKIRSTAKYGINLVFTDYEASIAKDIGMDFEILKDYDRDYNKLYHNLRMDWAQRYILDPPGGKIGGHCVVPNAKLLDENYPSELLKMILEMK